MTLLSIVSITRNDPIGIRRTCRSVAPQIGALHGTVEWVIWNGGHPVPTDLVEQAARYAAGRASGSYDAMNQGVGLASGDYVLFLNGGDLLLPNLDALVRDLKQAECDVLLCGYEVAIGRMVVARRARRPEYLRYGLPTSREAIVYRRAVLGPSPFRTAVTRDAVGDYELTARLWRGGATFARSRVLVSRFHSGDHASQRPLRLAKQASAVQRDVLDLGIGERSVDAVRRVVTTSVATAIRSF